MPYMLTATCLCVYWHQQVYSCSVDLVQIQLTISEPLTPKLVVMIKPFSNSFNCLMKCISNHFHCRIGHPEFVLFLFLFKLTGFVTNVLTFEYEEHYNVRMYTLEKCSQFVFLICL